MTNRDLKILKGSILVYRVFDLGEEVNLSQVETILAGGFNRSRFTFAKPSKSLVVSDAPISLKIGESILNLSGKEYESTVTAKLWNYGALSVCFQIKIEENSSWSDLVNISHIIDNSTEIDNLAKDVGFKLSCAILGAIQNANFWNTFEDYVIFFLEKVEGIENNEAISLIQKADVPELILGESKENLSDLSKSFILENVKQYSKNDLVVLDWNSALIYEPSGSKDVADVIEFSLTHLLEIRYYDDLLDKKLNTLYDSIQGKRGGKIFTDIYSKLAEDSGKAYIEFSEFLERVDNSLKTVGDFYLATVFRTANRKFRFEDWKKSVDRKMKNLAQISELLNGEVNSRRSHYLEIIIILLIAGEILAAMTPWLKSLF